MIGAQMIGRSAFCAAGAASWVSLAALLGANPAQAAGFAGDYDPSHWILTNKFANGSANGFVNVTQAPLAITMQGSDSGSGAFGLTSYTTVSRSNGFLSFDWDYTTSDSLPVWDPFYFLLNGTLTALAEAFGPVDQSASFSSPVAEGDIFGFVIETDDDAFGPASVTITNFHAPSSKPIDVPEPASLLGLLAVLSAGAVLHRRPERSS